MSSSSPQMHPAKVVCASCLILLSWLLLTLLTGCSTTWTKHDRSDREIALVPDPIVKVEPRSKYGNPASYVINGKRYFTLASSEGYVEQGVASWYGGKFHGRRTSSGEIYDMFAMTAAHPTLPLPTYVQVINLINKKKVIVRVNDRGPFHSDRVIDLSYAAAMKLDMVGSGTAQVEVRALTPTSEPLAEIAQLPSIYLQVGAFKDRAKAEQLQAEVHKTSKNNTRIIEKKSQEIIIYGVHVGPFTNREEAEKTSSLLSDSGLGKPILVLD